MDANAERDFLMTIRQAAQMVRAHISRHRSELPDIALPIDAVLLIVVQWVEYRCKVKRPSI